MYRNVNLPKEEVEYKDEIMKSFHLIKKYYYWFIITVLISLGIAYVYNKSRGETYNVYTSLMIEDEANSGMNPGNASLDAFSNNLGNFLPGNNNVDNQMYVLGSYDNVFRTVKKLGLDVSYFSKEGIFTRQIFNDFPFTVFIDKSKIQLVQSSFYLYPVSDKKFRLKVKCDDRYLYSYVNDTRIKRVEEVVYDKEHLYGEAINTANFSFVVIKNPGIAKDAKYSFVLNDPAVLANRLKGRIKIKRLFDDGGIIHVSLNTQSPERGISILNTFTRVYIQQNLDKKQALIDRMIEFVESQFENVSETLKDSEDKLQYYQSQKSVVDIAAQGQIIIQQINALENEKADITARLAYLGNLKENIVSNENHSNMVAPSVMGIADIVLNSLVTRINEINIQRSALVSGLNNPEDNPLVIAIDAQLQGLKESLLDNVENIISQIQISQKGIDSRISKNRWYLRELPSKQRGLVNIQRNNQINSELYSQLLERKLNYYIMKASNFINKNIVEEARLDEKEPFLSSHMVAYIVAFLLGVILPFSVMIVKKMFDNKVRTRKDIENISDFPFLGAIPKVNKTNETIIINNPLSLFSESYRLVRHSMKCMSESNNGDCFKILVTSGMSKEGKTTTCINIATTFAMLKKKVVVVECDMRKPELGNQLNINNCYGLSSYLKGECTIDKVICKTSNNYLDAVVCGVEPPDPAELIVSDRFEELVEELERMYDYIIFDTPPISLVADALSLSKHAHLKVLVVRSGIVEKKQLEEIVNRLTSCGMRDVGIILNAEESESGKYYGYRYTRYNN